MPVALVLGVLAAVAPLVLYGLVSGHPYPRVFVERRGEGFYAQLRPCADDTVHAVEVSPYEPDSSEVPPAFWTATVDSSEGATEIRLFAEQPGVTTSAFEGGAPSIYEVVINPNMEGETSLVVDESEVAPGEVAYGGDPHFTRAEYLDLPDGDFGCAP